MFSPQARLWWLSTLFYWLCITLPHLQQAADHLSVDVLHIQYHSKSFIMI